MANKTTKGLGIVDSLDKTIPPKKLHKVAVKQKVLKLPDYDTWSNYRRKDIVPFTLNPWDYCRTSPFSKTWTQLSTKGKRQQIIDFFKLYNDTFEDYFITFEFSAQGRFHAHGLIYLYEGRMINLYHFKEYINKRFGNPKHTKVCFKGTPMNSLKQQAFDKSYNYTTKDIQIMFLSKYRIKYSNKNKNTLVLQKNIILQIQTDLL